MATASTSLTKPADQGETMNAADVDFKVYKPPTHPHRLEDLPDSYFTPTTADLQTAQATLSARTRALANAPLQLRATRGGLEKAKRDRWPNTTIRIKFTDRTMLEKTFSSTDKIRAVYAFVRAALREDAKSIKFILYQSPPKRDLKVSDPKVRDLSLTELQLAPSSVLLLRFEDDALNGSNVPAPLAKSILDRAIDLPVPRETSSAPSPASAPPSQVKPGSATKSMPKWFKIGISA